MNYNKNSLEKKIKAVKLGLMLQYTHPEIGPLSEEREMANSDIVKDLDIHSKYSVEISLANDAIHYALEGYEGCSEFHTYEGLKK